MLDRRHPPQLPSARHFSFPTFSRFMLDNGLQIIALPDRRVPMTMLRLVLSAGAENDPAAAAGLAAMTAALLDEGTSRRTSLEIATAAEKLGGYLATSAGWSSARAETSLLTRDLPLGLELLADVVIDPTFPEHEVSRLKLQTLAHFERRRMQPAALVADAFCLALYGSGPYSRSLLGTTESIERIDRHHARSFYSKRITPDRATLLISGSFDLPTVERQVASSLGQWAGKSSPPSEIPSPEPADGRRVVLVDRPGAAQSEICVGHIGLAGSHPDFLVASVMNTLLGGKFTSRINLNLRERHALTYGAHSQLARRRGPGPFTVTAAVDNQSVSKAVTETLGELERLRQEPVSPGELSETIDYLIGRFPYSCETQAATVNRLHEIVTHHLPDTWYQSLPSLLEAVTPEDIQRCASDHLDPDNAIVAIAGPADELAEDLSLIGPVEYHENTD